jgi:hypothetical protein
VSTSTTTTLVCPPDGFDGLRCVLAPGLHGPGCEVETFPHRVEKRFARAEKLIDRAESSTKPKAARHKLRRVAKLLGRAGNGVVRLGDQTKIASDCAATLSAMLTEGEQRADALATTF